MQDLSSRRLAGKQALLACSKLKSGKLTSGLAEMGASVTYLPLIEVRRLQDLSLLDAALDEIGRFSWIIFTSAHAVACLFDRLEPRRAPASLNEMPKICAVGPATAKAIRDRGARVDLVPEEYVAEGVVAAMKASYPGSAGLSGLRFLLPRAVRAREHIPEALEAAGATVEVIPCYETVSLRLDPRLLRALSEDRFELAVFTSSSTVVSFMSALGEEEGGRILGHASVAALGPITARTLESYGVPVGILPEENSIEALLDAIGNHYR